MELKENLKQARLQARLTLEQAGQQLGITKATLQRYESGAIGNIPFENVERLADIYQTTPTQLMGWEKDALPILAGLFSLNLSDPQWDQHFRERLTSYYEKLEASCIDRLLTRYSALDPQGRHTVDTILDMEYHRCTIPQ